MIAAPDACELTIEEKVERLAELRRGLDVAELVFSRQAAEVARSSEFEKQGYRSPLDWIKKETKMKTGDAADAICVGEQLDVVDRSADAMFQGEIGFAHLVEIARTVEKLRESPPSRGFDQAHFLHPPPPTATPPPLRN